MTSDFLTGSPGLLQFRFSNHAQDDPDRIWCAFGAESYSYGYVDSQANRLAHAMKNEFSVIHGTAVAVCMNNCPEYFTAMFAIHRLGGVYVPCSTHYTPEELHYQLEHAEIAVVITDVEHVDLVTEASIGNDRLRATVVVGGRVGLGSLDDLIAGRSETPPAESERVTADDLAMLMYTSGTTDRPKGVMFSHGNLMTAADTAVRYFGWTKADRYLHHFPLFHANGGLYGIAPAIVSGASIAVTPKFSASKFGELLVANQATFVAVNSTHIKMILQQPQTESDQQHLARRMMLGLTLPSEDLLAFERRFNTRLIATYGLTESLGINVIGEAAGPRKAGSAGRVVRGYSLTIQDADGNELPANASGEAVLRSHQRHGFAQGYFKDEAKTSEIFRADGLATGDVLQVDDDGYVWFVGREKDMIKRSGFNVAAAEVERVIHDVSGVEDVAVVGTPDAMREEAIVAFVVPREGEEVDEEAVFAACEAALADYKRPQFVVPTDVLPTNFLGKVERKKLRQRALQYAITSTDRTLVGARGTMPATHTRS